MLLADSIEAWGRAKRDEMSRDQLEELGAVWRTIKTSPYADLDFREMGKDDARSVMALFDQTRRAGVSQTLNAVRKWALAQPEAAAAVPPQPPAPDQPPAPAPPAQSPSPRPQAGTPGTPVTPDRSQLPGNETVVLRGPSGAPAAGRPASTPGLDAGGPVAGPPGFSAAIAAPGGPPSPAPSGEVRRHGPVEGWQPPAAAAAAGAASGPNQNARIIGIVVAVLIVALLVWLFFLRGDDASQPLSTAGDTTTAADSGDGAATDSSDGSGSGAPAFDGGDSGDFCSVARELDESDPFSDAAIESFGPEFFLASISLLERVQAIAPAEIQADFATLVAQFRQLDVLAAQYDYDFFDPELGQALSTLDTTAADAAGERVDAYLSQVCGIDTGSTGTTSTDGTNGTGTVPGFDELDLTDEQIRQINQLFLAQFDISPELAECLSSELGDLTEAAADPSILNQPVCGTTLFEVVSGANG